MSELLPLHIRYLRSGGRSEKTIDARQRLVEHADQHLPEGVDNALPEEIVDYFEAFGWHGWTLHTYDNHLRGFYRWAYAAGWLEYDPMLNLIRPGEGDRLPNPCTDEEFAYLLTHAPEHPWRLAFLLAGYQGLRVSELARLRRQEITEERIRVVKGKGGKDAYVDTHPLVWDAVKDLPKGRVVRDADGAEVSGYQLTNRGWYLFRKLGLPDMHMHRLRHWHATALLAGGADLETVRQCMRHSSITSTAGYTLIASNARRAAVHRLPRLRFGGELSQLVSG